MIRVALLLVLAAPALAQTTSVAVGASVEAGVLGIEVVRHARGAPVGFAVGAGVAGVAGVGGRVQRRLRESRTDYGFETRYLSAGALLSPWQFGTLGSPVFVSVEYGAELAMTKGLYLNMGFGGVLPLGGECGGCARPSLRFTLGGSL